jgi:glycosyltransferase involved in cell wall biosynthesis
MKWICCQIGAREHYAVARALHRYHALDLLVTDAWIEPNSQLGRFNASLRARFHAELAAASVYAPNFGSIAFEVHALLSGLRNWHRTIARNEWFQGAVVRRLSRFGSVDGSRTLMAYSYAALEILRLAHARGWRTVLGQIDPGPPEERIVAKLYEEAPIHHGEWQPAPPQYWSSWRKECELADRIVVNSLWSKAALVEEGVPEAKIRVVPLAYEEPEGVDTFQRKYPAVFTPSRPLRVLFLGQINLRKGLGPLLDAISLLREEPIEFSLVGPIQISIPADLRDNPRVRWIGEVNRRDAARFYCDADVFLLPSFSDGFGLTQLEAQAWKLPVIASKFCGEVVEDSKNGWLLPDVTAEAIAATLRRCCRTSTCLQQLSANSELTERFDLAHVGRQWLHVFD